MCGSGHPHIGAAGGALQEAGARAALDLLRIRQLGDAPRLPPRRSLQAPRAAGQAAGPPRGPHIPGGIRPVGAHCKYLRCQGPQRRAPAAAKLPLRAARGPLERRGRLLGSPRRQPGASGAEPHGGAGALRGRRGAAAQMARGADGGDADPRDGSTLQRQPLPPIAGQPPRGPLPPVQEGNNPNALALSPRRHRGDGVEA
mmetsp:Transcript_13251/g.41920  ORF Transcript_13251/g.41920 Transcript_13251/m.41920 type:complete len:200 (+) Transcript_13251:2071-2670(+)